MIITNNLYGPEEAQYCITYHRYYHSYESGNPEIKTWAIASMDSRLRGDDKIEFNRSL